MDGEPHSTSEPAYTLYLSHSYPSSTTPQQDRLKPQNLSVLGCQRLVGWLGVCLVAAGLTIFLVGLEFEGNLYSWTKLIVIQTNNLDFRSRPKDGESKDARQPIGARIYPLF